MRNEVAYEAWPPLRTNEYSVESPVIKKMMLYQKELDEGLLTLDMRVC